MLPSFTEVFQKMKAVIQNVILGGTQHETEVKKPNSTILPF